MMQAARASRTLSAGAETEETGREHSGRNALLRQAGPKGQATDGGDLAAARAALSTAPLHEVAAYWQDNFDRLMQLDAAGKRHKQTDLARGRALHHVPSSIVPLLSGLRARLAAPVVSRPSALLFCQCLCCVSNLRDACEAGETTQARSSSRLLLAL